MWKSVNNPNPNIYIIGYIIISDLPVDFISYTTAHMWHFNGIKFLKIINM